MSSQALASMAPRNTVASPPPDFVLQMLKRKLTSRMFSHVFVCAAKVPSPGLRVRVENEGESPRSEFKETSVGWCTTSLVDKAEGEPVPLEWNQGINLAAALMSEHTTVIIEVYQEGLSQEREGQTEGGLERQPLREIPAADDVLISFAAIKLFNVNETNEGVSKLALAKLKNKESASGGIGNKNPRP
jgi:hypothetical protein